MVLNSSIPPLKKKHSQAGIHLETASMIDLGHRASHCEALNVGIKAYDCATEKESFISSSLCYSVPRIYK